MDYNLASDKGLYDTVFHENSKEVISRKIYSVTLSEFIFFRTFHFRTQFFSNSKPLVIQIISANVPNDKKHKILLITPSELVFRNIIFRNIKFSKYQISVYNPFQTFMKDGININVLKLNFFDNFQKSQLLYF